MRDGKVLFTTRCIEIMELQFVPKDNYGNLRFIKFPILFTCNLQRFYSFC